MRCSRVVRSRISTPSRWSISCWITRASRPEASTSRSLAVLVLGAHAHVDRALHVDVMPGDREAALLERLLVLARPLDLGVHERDHAARRGPRGRPAAAARARAAARRGPTPRASFMIAAPSGHLVAQRVVEAVDGGGAALQDRVAERRMNDIAAARRAASSGSRRASSSSAPPPSPRRLRAAPPPSAFESIVATRFYCGSTSTANATPRVRAFAAATASTARAPRRSPALALRGRLHEQLRAVAPLQPEQRRRARARGTPGGRDPLAHARRPPPPRGRALRTSTRRARAGRRAGSRAASRRPSSPARKPSESWRGGEAQRARVGVQRLHDHPAAALAAAAAPGELGDERERALLGAEVGEAQRGVGVQHHARA